MNYNPYFPGGGIAMARVLFDGLVEYEDGTPATTSQMAKDVVQFLAWAAEPEHDERKKMGLQAVIIISTLTVSTSDSRAICARRAREKHAEITWTTPASRGEHANFT